jgi:hypothetical protein
VIAVVGGVLEHVLGAATETLNSQQRLWSGRRSVTHARALKSPGFG